MTDAIRRDVTPETNDIDGTSEADSSRREVKSTHVLIPAEMAIGLEDLMARTRVRQAVYMREAVAGLLDQYATGVRRTPLPSVPALKDTRSLVFRLDASVLAKVKELATRTRVHQSVYLREALADLLAKYADASPTPSAFFEARTLQ